MKLRYLQFVLFALAGAVFISGCGGSEALNPPPPTSGAGAGGGSVIVNADLRTPLNDTGVLFSGTETANNLWCEPTIFDGTTVHQDCDLGNDTAGPISKVGSGSAGFDYTRLGANGQALAIQDGIWSEAGSELAGTRWSCVRDNQTNLVWEVKTESNKGERFTHTGSSGLVTSLNGSALCGRTNWRLPRIMELQAILHYGHNAAPYIDQNAFPNTQNAWHWSSDPSVFPRPQHIGGATTGTAGTTYASVWRANFATAVMSGAYRYGNLADLSGGSVSDLSSSDYMHAVRLVSASN